MTAFQWLTFAVAALGALTGIASLVWQAWTFRKAGAVVKVKTQWGIAEDGARRTHYVLTVTANNAGRGETEIRSWGILLRDNRQLVAFAPFFGSSPCPTTLPAQGEAMWMMSTLDIAEEVKRLNDDSPLTLRGFVRLGSGDRVIGDALQVERGALRRLSE